MSSKALSSMGGRLLFAGSSGFSSAPEYHSELESYSVTPIIMPPAGIADASSDAVSAGDDALSAIG